MQAFKWTVMVALAAAFPVSAMAQDTTTTAPPPAPPATAQSDTTIVNTALPTQWMASGFVGSNFGASTTDPSVDFGGQLAVLYRSIVGAELLADFAPSFKINNALLADNPNVNSYMLNAIGALPLGAEGRFQPFISGGVGGIQLRSDVLNVAAAPASGSANANQARFGTNIGGGLMAFLGNVGVRADVRYYRALTSDTLSTDASDPANAFAKNLLSGLDFWRANVGVAFRW
jgi:hypothetical protein